MITLRTAVATTCLLSLAGAASAQEHFDPKGNPALLAQLMSTVVQFTPDFEMLPGTAR